MINSCLAREYKDKRALKIAQGRQLVSFCPTNCKTGLLLYMTKTIRHNVWNTTEMMAHDY